MAKISKTEKLVLSIAAVKPNPSPRFTRDIKPLVAKWLKESGDEKLLKSKDLTFQEVRTFPHPLLDQLQTEHLVYVYYATKAAYRTFDQIILPKLKKLFVVKNTTKAVKAIEDESKSEPKARPKSKPKAASKTKGKPNPTRKK